MCRLDDQHGGIPHVQPRSFCGYFCEKSKDDISCRRLLFLRTTTFTRYMYEFCCLKKRKNENEINKNKKIALKNLCYVESSHAYLISDHDFNVLLMSAFKKMSSFCHSSFHCLFKCRQYFPVVTFRAYPKWLLSTNAPVRK